MNIEIIVPHIDTATQIVKETEDHTELPAKIEALALDPEVTENLLEFAQAHYRVVRARQVVAQDFARHAAEIWAEYEEEGLWSEYEEDEEEDEEEELVADPFDIDTTEGDYKVRYAISRAAREKLTYVGDAREILRHYEGPLTGLDVVQYLTDNEGLRKDVAAFARYYFWQN